MIEKIFYFQFAGIEPIFVKFGSPLKHCVPVGVGVNNHNVGALPVKVVPHPRKQ